MPTRPEPARSEDPVVAEYARLAARYEEKWSFYIDATLRATLGRVRIQPGERLLDVGCGTGVLLQSLTSGYPSLEIAGVDPTAEMLGLARRRLAADVCLQRARAEALPFADESFHVVVSCNVFHYIRAPLAALRESLRVLRSGGLLVVTDWCDDFLACRLCDLALRAFEAAHYRTYGQGECRALLNAAGFQRVAVEPYKISWFWGLMTATAHKRTA